MSPLAWLTFGWIALPFLAAGLLLGGAIWLVWQVIRLTALAVIALAALIMARRKIRP